MAKHAPLLTLAAVAALGVALFAVNATGGGPEPVAAVAAPPPAPTAEPPPPPTPAVVEQAFTGRSAGDEVTVAVAVKDGRAVGYVCDGEQVEAWVEGALDGDRLWLHSADGTTTVGGTVDGTAALGTVVVGGQQWPYAAAAVEAPAGLYEGRGNIDGVAARIGWIVENDGRVTGLARVAGSDGPRPAPPFDPSAPDATLADGEPVAVTEIGGSAPVVDR